MSWEAWGDGDDGEDRMVERLMESGWWPSEKAMDVEAAIKALRAEPVYEGGDRAKGISVKFLARVTLLEHAAEMRRPNDPMVVEAKGLFGRIVDMSADDFDKDELARVVESGDDGPHTWRALAEAAIMDLRAYAHDETPERRMASVDGYESRAAVLRAVDFFNARCAELDRDGR
jgi:hypothetical protein